MNNLYLECLGQVQTGETISLQEHLPAA